MVESLESQGRAWVEGCSRLGATRTIVIARGMDSNHRGKTGAERVLQGMPWVEQDLDGDPLHYLGKVAGGVIGRQQRKLGSASRRNLLHLPMEDDSREGIDPDVCRIS